MSVKEGFSDAEWRLLEHTALWVVHTVTNSNGVINTKCK